MSQEVHFCLMHLVKLGQPGSLEQILRKVTALGYGLTDIMVGHFATEIFSYWRELNDQVLKELTVAYEKGELTFLVADTSKEFFVGFWVRLNWSSEVSSEKQVGSITGYDDNAKLYKRKEYYPERNSQIALDLVRELYQVFSPSFGWIEICSEKGFTKSEDVENLHIPHIYWANFFGPQYVEKYGKAYFQNAPGWKVEFQEDGGCLYVLSPTLAPTPISLNEEVRTYFGVEHVRAMPKKK